MASTARLEVIFDSGDFHENLSRKPDGVKVDQKYRALFVQNQVYFIVIDDVKSP
jgi:hypothetical protein